MPTGMHTWSKTAADNNDADSSINWSEGQAPSTVNNSARAVMARIAEYRDDTAGTLTTAGTSTAYTLTTNTVFTSLALLDGQKLKVKFDSTNGAAPTLNVDGLGAKALELYDGAAIPTGMILADTIWDLTYDNTAEAFIVAGIPAVVPSLTVTGAFAYSAPAFKAHKNGSAQASVASGIETAVTYGTESFDIGGFYASNAWVPPAGTVCFYACALVTGDIPASGAANISIEKNGTSIRESRSVCDTGLAVLNVTTVDRANGTDSYSVTINVPTSSGTSTINGDAHHTQFCGYWVGA
jgi:hypothetical protein